MVNYNKKKLSILSLKMTSKPPSTFNLGYPVCFVSQALGAEPYIIVIMFFQVY